MDKIQKVFVTEIKEIDDKERTLTAVVSTADTDRSGEIIPTTAWKLENYLKNPVILWAHDYEMPPVGKALWTKVTEKGLVQKIKFATHQFAQDIYELYKGGFLNAFSVGFSAERDQTDPAVFQACELYEVSCVPVPCNQNALAERALQPGFMKSLEGIEIVKLMTKQPEREVKIEETADFIHYPVREVSVFEDGSFRAIAIDESAGISAVAGNLTGETTLTIQKYLFAKEQGWTIEKAKEWVKDHSKTAAAIAATFDNAMQKALQDIGELKAGRVLSEKNRTLVQAAIEALNALMEAADDGKEAEPENGAIDNGLKSVIISTTKKPADNSTESVRKAIAEAVKAADIPGAIRGELNRMKGIV